MKKYDIVNYGSHSRYPDTVDCVEADDERQALCLYLMNHPKMKNMVLYISDDDRWQLIQYGGDDHLFAKEAKVTDEEIIKCTGRSDECEVCPHFNRCVSVTAKHQEADKAFYEDLHLEQMEQM